MNHYCSRETLVSKANQLNDTVWSIRSMLVNGQLVVIFHDTQVAVSHGCRFACLPSDGREALK